MAHMANPWNIVIQAVGNSKAEAYKAPKVYLGLKPENPTHSSLTVTNKRIL
jgi:hypothetical protein